MAGNVQNLLPQDDNEWTELPILQNLVPIVAQLTTKVFTGEPLCNTPEWINNSINFTIEGSMASRALRSWSAILRPLIYRFIPEMRQIQNTYSRADKLLQKKAESRRLAAETATAEGKPAHQHKDALSWISDVADSQQYSMTQGQLLLSFAAIHTTSTTLYAFLFDLLSTPSLIPELRDEITTVLRADGGLTKTSIHKLNLLDSCQRLSPLGPTSLHRRVNAPAALPDGTRLPRGAVAAVSSFHMHREPAFDGRRYARLRQRAGREKGAQFVATSAEHFGFGHGRHACPGRVVVAGVLEVVLVRLLLGYGWRLGEGARKSVVGRELRSDPEARVWCRERVSEVEMGR